MSVGTPDSDAMTSIVGDVHSTATGCDEILTSFMLKADAADMAGVGDLPLGVPSVHSS